MNALSIWKCAIEVPIVATVATVNRSTIRIRLDDSQKDYYCFEIIPERWDQDRYLEKVELKVRHLGPKVEHMSCYLDVASLDRYGRGSQDWYVFNEKNNKIIFECVATFEKQRGAWLTIRW